MVGSWLLAGARALLRALAWVWSRVANGVARGAGRLRPSWLRLPAWVPTRRSGRRSLALTTVLAAGLVVLAARLVQVQVVDAPALRAQSLDQAQRVVPLDADRGQILDRSGAVLATSVQRPTVFVDPAVYTEFHADGDIDPDAGEVARADVVAALSSELDVSRSELWAALRDHPDRHYAVVAKGLKREVADRVLALGLPGVHTVDEPVREYPMGSVTAPLVGFTVDGAGAAGLEDQFDDLLTGEPGEMRFEVDARAALDIATFRRDVQPSVPGQDLVLTIDRELQGIATHVANETMAAHGADGVSIVVLDATSAEVLAVVSTPGYDPGNRQSGEYLRAHPLADAVEPGSVQKLVTVAAALEEGLIDRDTIIDVPATWVVGGRTWYESRPGPMTPTQIIERSSNVGSMQIGELVGPERLHDWMQAFGYGRPTGIEYPREAAGQLRPLEDWSATSLPTMSIGHGVSMSTIQLASVYQAIANDGVQVPPTLVRGALDDAGELVARADSPATEVLSAATAAQLREMLRQVVEGDDGTGGQAAVEGYSVGGKTGTAIKPEGGGYSDQTTAVFAGMAPIDDPELVIAVMVDEPETLYGGRSAASAFRDVMAHALVAQDVVPDAVMPPIEEAIAAARADAASHAQAEAAERARAERQLRRAIRRAVHHAAVATGAAAQPEEPAARRDNGPRSNGARDGAQGRTGPRAGQG